MFGIGFSELVLLVILALVLIGPDQLPDLARSIARLMNDVRRSSDVLSEELKNSKREILRDFELEDASLAQKKNIKDFVDSHHGNVSAINPQPIPGGQHSSDYLHVNSPDSVQLREPQQIKESP